MAKTKSENSMKKKNKKNKSGPNAVAMKAKPPKENPFETIWSRRKFDILGKKRKGEERRIGLARSLAVEKRKKTLLKEYEQSGKSSVFVDKRIGEQNDSLGEFDKAILRSQRERKLKVSKKNKYNLSDGEDDDLEIQGAGSFQEMDDFEDEVPFDDDNDGDTTHDDVKSRLKQLNADDTHDAFVPDQREEENKHKSKKEVMEEIIMKSKFFKAQKAKAKEENEELIEQLDSDFASLVQSTALVSLTQPSKMNALKSLVNKSISNDVAKQESSTSQNKVSTQLERPDFYDKLVGEMTLDMRARPSDRTKTPEEIAQEEKERLERLEEERQKRMLAADDYSDDDVEASKDDDTVNQRLRSISGDDLGDSFHDEEPRTKVGWIDEILRREAADDVESDVGSSSENSESDEDDDGDGDGDDDDEEETGEGNNECEKSHSLKDWEQSNDEKLSTDLEGEEEEDAGAEKDGDIFDVEVKPKRLRKAAEIMERKKDVLDVDRTKVERPSTQQKNLPFTIEAPKSLEEFSLLLENLSDEEIIEAIVRIRTFNSIRVAAENRKKMQVFYGILLQYFAVSANKRPCNFKLLNLLVKPLMEMSVEIPYFAAICARERLLRARTQFCEDIKNPGKSSWPSLKTLFLLRLWSMIFPCSDFRHPVMTPAILLICEYLMRCPILSGHDIAIGSFLCSMVLSVTKQSRKFCPEAIIFLRTLLMASLDRKTGRTEDSQLKHLMELKAFKSDLCIRGCVNNICPPNILLLMDLPEESPYFMSDDFRASMLVAVIETLLGFISIYDGFNSFPEIFFPFSKLLRELSEQEHMPNTLQEKLGDAAQIIEKKLEEHYFMRRPLQMRKQKPVPIKLLNPKFEENFVKGRDYDPDRERAERRKMKKLVKREAKGAARELRKDNHFLFEVKQKDKALVEAERAEKYGKARAFLQEQEHLFKSGQLGKGKKRGRKS